jgi:acyl-homoserine lactone acylase PvdQ
MRRLPALLTAALLAAPAAVPASAGAAATGFHSVLAFGEGTGTSAAALAGFEASAAVPPEDLNQRDQYEGIEQAGPTFGAADLLKYYKDSSFRTLAAGDVASTETPRAGVRIVRDKAFAVPRIYGDTRSDVMWGAGYATAENRLFFMDVLRHTAEGTTADLLGSSAVASDSRQLGLEDRSPEELTKQIESLPQTNGAEGAKALQDITDYVSGINAFIDQAQLDPTKMPAEYPALGIRPQPWTLADSAAEGIYLIGQFTVFGGQQPEQAEALGMAQAKLGTKRGGAAYRDLRFPADPEAVVTLTKRFGSDATGKVDPRSVAMIDPGSLVDRDAQTGGPVTPSTTARAAADPAVPAWAQALARHGLALPHHASNAVLVDGKHSGTGQALAVMGPQVSYFTPEVFFEYELHGGGIDSSGVSFPGASPYPLIGHGADFAYTGTSAFSANKDVFAERLCNPDGSAPSFTSTHYLYKGTCTAFATHDVVEQTPVAPTSPSAPQTVTLHTLRSVHGPVGRFATVHGVPVALAGAAAPYDHESQSYVAFMRLAENTPTSPQSFISAMRAYTGSENWFYVDHSHIGVLQSGWFPRHARGTDPDLPIWGTGQWDWQGFDPATYDYRRLPASANPTAVDPARGYLVNWNNAIAHGWRVAAGDWVNGPVHRASMLLHGLRGALGHKPVDLASLSRLVTAPSLTQDLRGLADWPWMRRIIGTGADPQTRQLVALLDAWSKAGSQRRDLNGDNVVDDSAAVLLMDTWWPQAVRAEFQPALGRPLLDFVSREFNSIQPDGIRDGSGNGFFAGFEMDVQKDLRQVLHRPVRGRFSRTYCGAGSLSRCRALLVRTLDAAGATLSAKYGASTAGWKLPVTCPVTTPAGCDQIVPTSAGAISIPPQPFDNRGTFYQAVAVSGKR